MRPGQSSCRLLALPQEDLGSSAWVVHRHPSAGSLGGRSYVPHGCHRFCFSFYMCVCVGNWKVPAGVATLLFPWARNFTQSTQLGPNGLVSTGEAAHPAVIPMGTWCKLGKQISNCCPWVRPRWHFRYPHHHFRAWCSPSPRWITQHGSEQLISA